jgi:hypothetical protein
MHAPGFAIGLAESRELGNQVGVHVTHRRE